MTITHEETPRLANGAERKVYQALIDQLQPNDRVIAGQRVTDHLKDHEVDFVVELLRIGPCHGDIFPARPPRQAISGVTYPCSRPSP